MRRVRRSRPASCTFSFINLETQLGGGVSDDPTHAGQITVTGWLPMCLDPTQRDLTSAIARHAAQAREKTTRTMKMNRQSTSVPTSVAARNAAIIRRALTESVL